MRQLNMLVAPERGRHYELLHIYYMYIALYIFQTLTAMETETQDEEKATEEK